eukprot:Skav216041  [mRNA]  locus=scaffold2930:41271:42497:+ [translate_table: standard]
MFVISGTGAAFARCRATLSIALLDRCGFVTLCASQFRHLWEDAGATACAYNGHPLASLNPARRGALFQEWAKRLLQQRYPNHQITDAMPGTHVDGRRRGRHQTEYDFMMNGRKVEIKGAQLHRNAARKQWCFQWKRVKFPHLMLDGRRSFDDLYLVLFSPKWLHLVKHDMSTGISTSGLVTHVSGHIISVVGLKHSNWDDSLDAILGKLCERGGCSIIGQMDSGDSWLHDLCKTHTGYGDHFYSGKPFATMSPALRGQRLQKLVLEMDQLLHPESSFSMPCNEFLISGRKRGNNTASADWIRDFRHIEVKHAKLRFSKVSWRCTFYWVKKDCFDELLLAIYSPWGLDVFKHDGIFGLTSTGQLTQTRGMFVEVSSGRGELDWLVALQKIRKKLERNNCPRIASIPWDL